jgi:putative methionine-R-sulfoxide reductase with GAF domain
VHRANEALRRAEAESRHRPSRSAALLGGAPHRRHPGAEELMQRAADQIRARMTHPYVAVVVLDEAGSLVGRWAGRPGLGRTSAGRAVAPLGGIIGRAIRLRAPQVVGDVTDDPDYHPDVSGTRSEMAIPLLEGAEATGALDFQSEQPFAFALDDVAAGETLAEFLVIALRNARSGRRGVAEQICSRRAVRTDDERNGAGASAMLVSSRQWRRPPGHCGWCWSWPSCSRASS